MAITFESGRQNVLLADYDFTYADMTDATYMAMVQLPINAVVTNVQCIITTLFNSGTTDIFSIGDQETGASASAAYYAANSADVTAVPTIVPGIITGKKYTVGGTVGVRWDGTGTAPTTGAGTLIVQYYIDGRATENQPQ